MEIFKDIKEFEGLYQISNLGNVLNVKTNKILSKRKYGCGYYGYALFKNKKRKEYKEHRLVAENFINNEFNLKLVNHINGIKTDNRVENLEWVTSHENHIHAMNLGLKAKGEGHGCSKLKMEDVYKIKTMLKEGVPQRKISKLFNVGQSAITDINLGKTWKHL